MIHWSEHDDLINALNCFLSSPKKFDSKVLVHLGTCEECQNDLRKIHKHLSYVILPE